MKKILMQVLMLLSLSAVMLPTYAVELNSASANQLMALKGIGAKTADLILQERQRAGPFITLEDFSIRVKGIGKKRLQNLINQGLHIDPSTIPNSSAIGNSTISTQGTNAPDKSVRHLNSQPGRSRADSSRKIRKKAGAGYVEMAEPQLIKPPNSAKLK